jgi:chromosome segregation and condensation protein ScpB
VSEAGTPPELKDILHALLFVADAPLSLQTLCEATGEPAEAVEAALHALQEELAARGAVQLVAHSGRLPTRHKARIRLLHRAPAEPAAETALARRAGDARDYRLRTARHPSPNRRPARGG